MYIYVYIYIFIYICLDIYIYIYIYIYINGRHTCSQSMGKRRVPGDARAISRSRAETHRHAHRHTYIQTHKDTRMRNLEQPRPARSPLRPCGSAYHRVQWIVHAHGRLQPSFEKSSHPEKIDFQAICSQAQCGCTCSQSMGKRRVPGDARAISRSRAQRAARFVPVATTVAPASPTPQFN
jgi:hypothetical protein